jgi:hypothetical protein
LAHNRKYVRQPILRGAPLGGESERKFFAFFKPGCRKHTDLLLACLLAATSSKFIVSLWWASVNAFRKIALSRRKDTIVVSFRMFANIQGGGASCLFATSEERNQSVRRRRYGIR